MSPKEESASKATPSSASAAVVKKSDETAKATKASPLHNFKQLFTFFRLLFATNPTWIDILLIISGTIFAAAAGVPFPLMGIIFGQLVDDMNGATCAAQQDDQGDPFRFEGSINDKVIKTAYIGAIALVLIYSYFVSWSVMSQRLAHRLRSQYVAALLRQSPAFFDVRSAAGEVSSRLHGDITAVQDGTSEKVGIFITTWSFFTTVFVIAFTKQPRLAGMLVSMLPAYLISVGVGSHYIKKFMAQASVAGDGSSIASEALSNIPVVRAFSAASRLEAKFADYVARGRTAGIKRGAIAATQAGMLYFVSYSGIALAFWQGSKMIAESAGESGGGATIGEIYAIVYLLIDSCVMLGNLAPILPIIGGASTAYLRLMEDIEAYSAVDGTSDEGHKLQPSLNKSIALRNVSFEYPSRAGQQVLRNVDVAFPAGSYTAIVGLSGSGKSTIAALIDRLYDPDEGIVEIDGVDLKTMNVRNLRSFISFVQQEPSLLDRSIFENIALGLLNSPKPAHEHLKPLILGNHLAECATKGKDTLSYTASKGAAYEELVALVTRAAEQADAINFVQGLQDGFGTMVGSKGALLSGGQRQRIALARALIRDPEILVLDEATSALDSASEKRIQRAVEQAATESRTVISIAHRLSTIRNADNIIVMEGGKVVEQGTYANLTANEQGAFARMVRLQSVGTTDDAGSLSGETTKGSVHTDDPVTAEKADANDQLKDTDKPVETQPVESPDDSNTAKADPPVTDPILSTTKPFGAAMKGAWWLVKPSRPFVILAIFAATLVGGTFSGSGLIFGYAVGGLNTCSNSAERILYLGRFFSGLMFMLAVVEFFANFFSWSSFGIISQRLLYSVKVLSFRSLLEQDVQWHQSGDRTASGLLEIITKDCAAVGGFSGSTLGTVFAVLVNVVVAVILSHIIGWKIALVCLASIPILLGAGFMQLRMLARYRERHTKAFSSATSVATEAVQSIRTVAALSLENQFMENYFNLLSKPRKELVVASASANIWLALNSTCSVFLNALAYWWGSQLMMKGEYTQTQFLIILIAMLTASKIWASMFTLAPEFGRAYSAFCHVLNVIELGSNHQLDQGGNSLRKLGGASPESKKDVEAVAEVKTPVGVSGREGLKITFTNVSFSYPNRPDAMVLDNVSFTVQPNQFCGLVGPSGAGKSTIMNLVQQLYSPTRGSILIDGEDILDVWPSIKDSVALVPQDPSLFAGSVRFNVGLGAPPDREATDAEIEEACKLANIHDFIVGLSDGYDSECGPSASHLSGGQRQRLAIARALVRRPRLLLLDESSSALDAASEAALQEGLEKVARSTTVLAITHRIHTVRRADTILVLEAGEIAERGRHTELMERSENYRINAMQQMLQ